MTIVLPGPFWSLHTHSVFSFNDAIAPVQGIVDRAVQYGYPAIGLTDHGNPAGSLQLYRAARKAGIEPLPGMELYVVPDSEYAGRSDSLHLTINAYNETGYRNLCNLATLTARRFWYKPLVDFADFAAMAEDGSTAGLAVSTGCFFGVLPQVLMRQGFMSAVQVAEALAGWFPRVYVEMQNHGIDTHRDTTMDITDDELIAAVYDVAQYAGLPTVITRDSHYLDIEDKPVHEGLKTLMSFSDDVDDAAFPGGGYYMTDTEGMREFIEPKYLEAGLAGLTDLAEAAYLRLPELENFKLRVPNVPFQGDDPQTAMETKVLAAYEAGRHAGDKRHLAQLRDEFDVIRSGEMAPYILLCDWLCEFMREKDITWHVRGSASASAVLYHLGVSQIDPIRFGLRFDRFLSSNRMKPPDVDFDVEHTRRDEVIAQLEKYFAVRSIGSHMKYSLEEDEDNEEGKGSLRVRFFSTLKKKGIDTTDWKKIPKAEVDMLYELAARKLYSGFGRHAAGYIVSPDADAVKQLPMTYIASSKKFVTSYGKKDVELLGFVKLDLLGLRTRTAIRSMCELSGVDFEAIPENDRATYASIGQGNTTGVFQLDGYAMRKGCEQLKPKKLADIIAAQALFRPATLNSGATGEYRARRKGVEPVPQRHPDIMDATKETYGVLLYQEQVMDVMSALGMNPAQLEEMLDAVKASNEYSAGAAVAIAEMMPTIREMALGRGWGQVDIDWLADGLGAYADYSFNKAHAAGYGLIAYRTAYMRVHHPVEFWTGMLQAYHDAPKQKGKRSKEEIYLMEARRKDGVRVLPPHVNRSAANYTLEHGSIRKGLMSVKGVGVVTARELVAKAPYSSLTDLGERVLPRKVGGAKSLALRKNPIDCGGAIAALEDIGALAGLEHTPQPEEE